MKEPSDYIYSSFNLFIQASEKQPITEMSAGVNWQVAGDSVKDALKFEIDGDISYRNYGRSAGGKIITDIIEYAERKESNRRGRVKAVLTNGATDGAHSLISYFLKEKMIKPEDCAVMVGFAFPIYSSLMHRFGIPYHEISDEMTIVPVLENLLEEIKRLTPTLIFIPFPHNPSGMLKAPEYYKAIIDCARDIGAKVIIDRVCLMSWDDVSAISPLIYEQVAEGHAFVIDSFSKSNSLAGIRLGYVLMAEKYLDGVEQEIRCRSLNPVVFGSSTLALCRLGDLAFNLGKIKVEGIIRLLERYGPSFWKQYPSDFTVPAVNIGRYVSDFIDKYSVEQQANKRRIEENFTAIEEAFGATVAMPLILDAGFNVILKTRTMQAINEAYDQAYLASTYGVCVLTRRCFVQEPSSDNLYFIRLSLTIPTDSFKQALQIMKTYYDTLPAIDAQADMMAAI